MDRLKNRMASCLGGPREGCKEGGNREGTEGVRSKEGKREAPSLQLHAPLEVRLPAQVFRDGVLSLRWRWGGERVVLDVDGAEQLVVDHVEARVVRARAREHPKAVAYCGRTTPVGEAQPYGEEKGLPEFVLHEDGTFEGGGCRALIATWLREEG